MSKPLNEDIRKTTIRPQVQGSTPKISPPSGGSNVSQPTGSGQAGQTGQVQSTGTNQQGVGADSNKSSGS